jgi:hypothetical protein
MQHSRALFVSGAVLFLPSVVRALNVGQIDTFENGTTLNWGGGSSPTNIPTDGPAGVGDHYLRITSNNSGLASFNGVQWAGNYTVAGITAVAMDLRNQGATNLSMRVALFNSPGGDFTTTTAILLPADNQWHHLIFGLTAADLTYVGGGTGSLSDTLANVGRLLFRHQSGTPLGSGQNTPITGTLNADNILAVPEPTALAGFAVLTVVASRRRGRLC